MSVLPGTALEGLRLLDEHRFHAAHAAFERAWREAEGVERQLWKSLVQLAAAFHHAERGRLRPAITLLGRARRHLAGIPDASGGVDVSRLRQHAVGAERRLLEALASGVDWRPGLAPLVEIASPGCR